MQTPCPITAFLWEFLGWKVVPVFICLCTSLRTEVLRCRAGIIDRNIKGSSEFHKKFIRLDKLVRTAESDISRRATIQKAKATNQPLSTSPTTWQGENLQFIKKNDFYQLSKILHSGWMLRSKCGFRVIETLSVPRGMTVQSWCCPKLKRP